MEILVFILGLLGLWLGAELAIRGTMDIGRRYKISKAFLGLTILAFGTDIPEIFVHLNGAFLRLSGVETSALIVSETLGTSFSQMTLMMGIVAMLGAVVIKKKRLYRDGFMVVAAVVALILVGMDGEIQKAEGLLLMVMYAGYFTALVREERVREVLAIAPKRKLWGALLLLAAGFVLMYYAAEHTVASALIMSERWGILQSTIGFFMIGLGTSLPELATSLTAIKQKHPQLAIGNIMGSTIFDLLFVLGLGSAISGFLVSRSILIYDMTALLAASLIVIFLFMRKMDVSKKECATLIFLYFLYAALKLGGVLS